MITIAYVGFFVVLALWSVVSVVLIRERIYMARSLCARKAMMWDLCAEAARRGEKVPQGVFLLGIRKPTTEELEHGMTLDNLTKEM